MWTFSCAFCLTVTCVGFPPAPELALCVTGLVCTCFGSPGLPFASLCALASAPMHALFVAGCMCLCFISPSCPLCHKCYVFFWLCQEGCMHLSRFVFLLSLGARVPLCASCVCLPRHTRPPGPPLCAARAVPGWACMMHHPRFPTLAFCLGPQSMNCQQAEKSSFLCLLPSKALLCLVFRDFEAPPWARL